MSKRSQIRLSFGMIFSIILIIIFITFAFYVIYVFLDLQETIQVEQFTDKLQNEVDKMWKGSQGSKELSYNIPADIESVCFVDDEFENVQFRSEEIIGGAKIEHIGIAKITESENVYCIDVIDGKIKFTIKKDFGENLVIITG